MNFSMEEAIEVLERTPKVLETLFTGLSDAWLVCNEGEGTWNASQVLDHLIEGEKSNWIPRLDMILSGGEGKPFPEFDRFAHLNHAAAPLSDRLSEFKKLRGDNILKLQQLVQHESQLECTGMHPAFGSVKASELIATWVVHDMTHLSQIVRVMAGRYREDVGPWIAFLSVLQPHR
ncbi:DinB family protein [Paenibacillus campinasensis]|uniref:DinB-like domain-containing protein n=1 Tax=Paenibacillus campinasensis TaxID=66347 RepID=A0A268EUX0_9BACL|nr:DinB family protein [Paenibacillus campinasensis]PAD76918.1 hypothetical protein CHH67_11120 [Paenibacillus campinasensis]